MPRTPWRCIPAAVLVITLTSLAANSPKQEKQPAAPAVDLYGDPLPEGAVGRLGTIKWRHGVGLNGLAIVPGTKNLASSGNYGFGVCIWDMNSGTPSQRLPIADNCSSLAFSPDGKLLFTNWYRVIEVASGKILHSFAVPTYYGRPVAFSPDGKTVAMAATGDKTESIWLWDAITGARIGTITPDRGSITRITFSPNGKLLAAAFLDNSVHFWDVASSAVVARLETSNVVRSISFSLDGKLLAAAGAGAYVWEVDSGNVLSKLSGDKKDSLIAFSPDSKLVAVATEDGHIRLCEARTGKELRRWQAHHESLASITFAADGKTIYAAGPWASSSMIAQWDLATGKEALVPAHHGSVESAYFDPDGKSLVSWGYDRKVLYWELATGRVSKQFFSGESVPPPETPYYLWGMSPDGKLGAFPSHFSKEDRKNDEFQLWNNVAQVELARLRLKSGFEPPARFSRDGRFVAVCAADGPHLLETATGKELHHLRGSSMSPVFTGLYRFDGAALAFSHDSKQVLWAGVDKTIRLCETETGKEIRSWASEQKKLTILALPLHGKCVASVDEHVVYLWSTETGNKLRKLVGQIGTIVDALAFSPSGRVLAAANREVRAKQDHAAAAYAVTLWDANTGLEIRRIDSHQAFVRSLAFSPDSRSLATGGGDSTILLWDLTGYGIPGQFGKFKEPPLLSDVELQTLWSDLTGDAPKAEKALWTLAFSPKQCMPLLKERLHVTPAPADEIAKLLAALEGPTFAERQKAAAALDKLGDAAEAAVRKHIEGQISPEAKQRLQQFLEKRDKEVIRKLRAIDVVEQIGTPEARDLLRSITKQAMNPRVAEAATSALTRHDKMKSSQ